MLSMISSRTIRPNGAPIDILEDLGLTHAQQVYDRRILALSTPGVYSRMRKTEWDKLAAAVKKTYDDTVGNPELATAGIPMAERQQLAVNAAKMTYATQNAILEANFPSGSQAIAMESFAQQGFSKTAAMLPMKAAPRRAPRRKATRGK